MKYRLDIWPYRIGKDKEVHFLKVKELFGWELFRISNSNSEWFFYLPTESKIIIDDDIDFSTDIIIILAGEDLYLLNIGDFRFSSEYIGSSPSVVRGEDWTAICGTTGVVLVSSHGDLKYHQDGYGIERPVMIREGALSYTSDLYSKSVSVLIEDMKCLEWRLWDEK